MRTIDPDLFFEQEAARQAEYWEQLRHHAAIAAMQGILAKYGVEPLPDDLVNDACEYAHALVERLKEKEARK